MKLEVGMYARTINGKIWIIKSQKAISGHKKDIINASSNIIDLIEVGDYVNGYKVIDIVKGFKIIIDKLELDTTTGLYHNIGIKDIKSIVTKEQFESMEYKIKE